MKKLNNKGMTILELLIYMLLVSVFLAAALFLLMASNEFVKESNDRMKVQNEFRLASIYVKNSIKRQDFKNGFSVVPLSNSKDKTAMKISFKSEADTSIEIFYIYFDQSRKQLLSVATNASDSMNSETVICSLDTFDLHMDKDKKNIQVKMSYGNGDLNLSYEELIHFNTTKE